MAGQVGRHPPAAHWAVGTTLGAIGESVDAVLKPDESA